MREKRKRRERGQRERTERERERERERETEREREREMKQGPENITFRIGNQLRYQVTVLYTVNTHLFMYVQEVQL